MTVTLEQTLISRRRFLATAKIAVAFSLSGPVQALAAGAMGEAEPTSEGAGLPDDMVSAPYLDAWIELGEDGLATVFTGKAELGQGIKTALLQIAAEELDLPPSSVTIVTADTGRTPDEGLTAASHSMQYGGPAMRNAAANVRLLLLKHAANIFDIDVGHLETLGDGTVVASDGRIASYGQLASGLSLHITALPDVPLRKPSQFRTMGKSLPRLDIPAKLSGGKAFVQDIRLPGMLHARVLRGPSEGMRLDIPSADEIEAMPGVYRFVQNGDFAAIVCEREWDAIRAMRQLQGRYFKRAGIPMPAGDVFSALSNLPAEDYRILDVSHPEPDAVVSRSARYSRGWLSHGSIGPSCALAQMKDGTLTIWSHSQGVFDVRRVAADLLGHPIEKIRAIHAEGAGCYGQNGADDVAAEAAFIAAAVPGRPIRLQWMREQEFGWEPLGPGMFTQLNAGLDRNKRIVSWRHEVWSNPHDTRPVGAGGVLIGRELKQPFPEPEVEPIPMPAGDGSRNSNPLYSLPNMQVTFHFVRQSPMRTSALRSLGGHLNIFSIESMFDELALAGAIDPLDLRLDHMEDPRALAVMRTGARAFGWRSRHKASGSMHGFGMGFARYKNLGAYCAVFLEVRVERDTGVIDVLRAQAAVDCGEAVNPDGIRNQVEGGLIQSLSWCTREQVTYDKTMRTSFDWSAYPILRFADVPQHIDVAIVPGLGQPFLGVAEAAQGPASAALANAVADATGVRFRDMPITPEKIRAAIVTGQELPFAPETSGRLQ